jgi:hypothetical protein
MNSLELRGLIGSIRLQQLKGQKTVEETITALQSIDWDNVEEFEVCPISSLKSVVDTYIEKLNQQ